MKDLDIITTMNERNKNVIIEQIKAEGKIKALSTYAEILDKRAYLTMDVEGNLKRKETSIILPIFAFFDDEEILAENILKYGDIKERQILEKIDRFSNIEVAKVKENLMKTIFNGSIDFAKKYAKELFLRDKKEFFRLMATFVTIGNSESLKSLNMIAFERLMEENDYNGNILYLFIAYLTKYRDNTNNYENIKVDVKEKKNITVKELEEKVLENEELLNSKLGLGIMSTLDILRRYNIPNERIVLKKLVLEIEGYTSLQPLNDEEKEILKFFVK